MIFRIEIRNASATPSKSNQLRNVNTIRWESRTITIQAEEIDYRKSEVIAFVVNAGMNITANNFLYFNQGQKFLCLKYLLCSTEVPSGIYIRNMFLKGTRFFSISFLPKLHLFDSSQAFNVDIC